MGTEEDNATRISDAVLSMFLSLVFNKVNVENPSSHMYVVAKGNCNRIAFLPSRGNSPLLLTQDEHKFNLSRSF